MSDFDAIKLGESPTKKLNPPLSLLNNSKLSLKYVPKVSQPEQCVFITTEHVPNMSRGHDF